MNRRLLIFNLLHGPNIDDLTPESNSWYLKNYEVYFEEIAHLCLMGRKNTPVINGKSSFFFAGSGGNLFDLILAPYRLYRFVKKYKPNFIITYEQVWLWWAIILVKLFTSTPVYLVPMTYPEQMYKLTGKGITGRLPIWVERFFLTCGYRLCTKVITSVNLGNYINWMKEKRIINKKLIIVNSLPESVIFPEFMKRLKEIRQSENRNLREEGKIKLVYVGRLHKEKLTDHLIKAMPLIKSKVPGVFLTIVGQGPDKDYLLDLAGELGVVESIKFQDYVTHNKLPDILVCSDIFVSPSTGHAFREAAMCGLPIVAYNIDWIKGFLTPNENFYGIKEINYEEFANGIIKVSQDNNLRKKLSSNIKAFAERYWSGDHLQQSLVNVFESN